MGEDGKPVMKSFWKLTYYTVFHITQVVKANKIEFVDKDGKKKTRLEPTEEPMTPVIQSESLPCVFEPIEQA